jgi:hypothetical protein
MASLSGLWARLVKKNKAVLRHNMLVGCATGTRLVTQKANGGIGVASRLGAQIVQVSRLKKEKKLKKKKKTSRFGGHTKRCDEPRQKKNFS